MKIKQLLMALVLCLSLAVPAAPASRAMSDQASAMSDSAAIFVRRLDDLAYFEELGEPIPFTLVPPSHERALRLGGLLRDLADRLESGDTSSNSYKYGDVSVEVQWPTPENPRLSFSAARVMTAPITLSLEDPASDDPGLCNDSIDNHGADPADGADQDDTDCSYIGYLLNGGGIKARLELSGEFVFASEDDELYLAQPPTMTLSIQGDGSDIVPFEDQFGFAGVVVAGQADLDEVITFTFEDPDDDGRITETEWTLTAIEDLTMVGYDPGSAVAASLTLESNLLGPDEVGTIELNLDRSVDPDWPVHTELSFPEPLRQFTNIDSDKALAGLNSYAVSLNAALLAGEVPLPFLDKRFSDAFSPGDSLVELVKQQTDALVICGKTNTLPPTGDATEANPLYCQAITYANPSEVIDWSLEGATLDNSVSMSETVGVSPQRNVKFLRDSTGERPRARVEFRDPDGLSHTVFPRVLSAQQLADELAKKLSDDELASGAVALRFDSDHSALMYDLSMEISPPMTTTQFAFADQLRQATHLANLRSTATTEPEVGFTNVVLSSTFGVLLLDDDEVGNLPPGQERSQGDCDDGDDNDKDGLTDGYDPDCPAPNGPGDRFFLIPSSDSPTIAVDDLVLTGAQSVELTGNIGFLGVSATGPFTLSKGDQGDSILEIDINSGGGYSGITNAIRIREFLADSQEQVTSAVNLNTTAALQVESEGLSESLTGSVNVAWDLAESESPTIEPDPDFSSDLRPFDIAPTLTGFHTGSLTTTVLIDTSRDFVADLGGGVQAGDVLNLELSNLTDGSNCPSFQVEQHELTCVTSYSGTLPITGTLAGGERNTWAPGDEYGIQGDPRALGNLVLDSFYKLATEMKGLDLDNPATAEFASPLPLIGLSARDLATQLDAIAAAVVDLKSGTEDAEVKCELEPPDKNEAEAGNLFCRAFTDVPEITAAKWSLSAGHGVFTETVSVTDTVRISPTAATAFSLSVPTAERDEFQITVVFTDSSDISYSAHYPPTPINDLSDLKDRLVALLRRNEAEINLELSPEHLSSPADGGTSNLHLVPKLALQEKETQRYRLFLDFGEVEMAATDDYSQSLSLNYDADVQMDVAIPLSNSVSAYDVWVRETTGLTLSISAGDSEVDLKATLGGAEVAVGARATLMGIHSLETFTGTHTSKSVSTTTLTASLDIEALGAVTGTLLTNTGTITTSKNTTCTVQAIAGDVVTCQDPLSGGEQWEQGDGFQLTSPSTKRLHDPEIDFSEFKMRPGSRVTNTTKDAACTIALPIPDGSHVLSCTNVLSPTAAWEQEDEYEIEGMGEVEMELASALTLDRPHSLADFTEALTHTFSSPRQDVISATLWVSLTEGGRLDQDVEVAYRLEDLPDGSPRGEFDYLLAAVQEAPIDWTMLPLPLELLDDIVRQNLDGRWWNFGVPLVGYDLAAGAEGEVGQSLETIAGDGIALDGSGVVSGTMQALCSGPGKVITESVQFKVVTDTIGTYDCSDAGMVAIEDEEVKDLEITFTISDTEKTYRPGFGLGLPGLPVTAEKGQTVQAEASWALSVTFGLSRTVGPYIRAADEDGLLVTATASFPKDNTTCIKALQGGDFTESYTETRCLNTVMGFLPGTLFDNEDNPSTLALTTTLNLNASNDLLTFGQMLKRTSAHTVQVWAAANVDVAFAADLDRSTTLLPIAGTFHLGFDTGGLQDVADGIKTGWITEQPSYQNIRMNVASFFGGFVGPMVEDVQDFTRPLQPPIDTLSAPVPVINDLSQALGQGPVSMLTMLAAVSGNDLTLLERLGGFVSFLNNLPADDQGVWIDLGDEDSPDPGGAFSLNVEETLAPPCYEDEIEDWLEGKVGPCEPDNSLKKEWEKLDKTKTKSGREVTKKWAASASASYSAGGISLPFLSDTRQIYGMLLGIDATLLRVDFGTLSASAGFSYSYYTVFVTPIGPIPVEFIVGGDVSVSGRFAMGYDTRGLRHALAGESFTGTALLDGIFIDDYDADGNEVPELTFSATFYAGAAVSIRIVKVGLDMGVTFTIDLDLNDPNADGKMYIDEIMLWRFNPVCLFEFTGTLEFFLRMYVEVDLFFFTARAEWYPFRHAINLFNVKCEPPDPVLAEKAEYKGKTVLRLNVGGYAKQRNIYMDETDEKMTVLQLTALGWGCSTLPDIHEYGVQGGPLKAGPSSTCPLTQTTSYTGTWVSVAFQGIKQSFFLPAIETVPIYADAAGGKDVIRLEPGSDQDGNEVPFELQAWIWGGDGDDRITTGSGDDVIYGGGGQDVINAGLGDDTIDAGLGDDSVDANLGDDLVYGGEGNDILNGGPGIDALDGGGGDDRLTGGPGLPAGFEDELRDKDDILVGGGGDDLLEGDYGRNFLFGDALQGYTGNTDNDEDGDIDEEESLREFHAFLRIPHAADELPPGFNEVAACQDGENGVSGNDTLTGGNEDDLLFGGPENDSLAGGKGDDYVCGNAGHDILEGSQGDDNLYGGLGNDQLRGGSGDDLLVGGVGDDLLRGDIGYDALVGDLLSLEVGSDASGSDALVGSAGNDLMLGDSGWITITDNLSATNTAVLTEVLASIDLRDMTVADTVIVSCSLRVGVISGTLDLNGDGVVNGRDTGFFEGYPVVNGYVNYDMDDSEVITGTDTGFINSILIQDGLVDASGDGVADTGDTGTVLGVAIVGGGNADCLFGNEGTDYLFGGPDKDELFGDAEMDYLEGNGGHDTMRGGQDNDIMYGDDSCTQTGCADGAVPAPPVEPGNDRMFGDSGDDQMYGSAGNDIMRGGIGDDTMEGNQDSDEMYGDADHDDMIGGTSRPGIADADDLMHGNAGHDMMAGDNASITRTGGTQDLFTEVTGVPLREVSLYDVAESGVVPLPDPPYSGKDVMWGDTGYDLMYGQGNGEMAAGPVANLCNGLDDDGNGVIDDEGRAGDCMHGGDGPDYMEGNAGDDTMYGDAGEDDLLGGTGRIAGDPEDGVDGRLDGADLMHGGPGFDFMAGDNAILRRTLVDGQWALAAHGGLLHDPIFLREVNWDEAYEVSGGDEMYGDGQNDVLYGQGSGDSLYGGDDHDYLEGNAGSDVMEGNAGQDDLIGGTGLVDHALPPEQAWFLDAGDWMYGEAGEGDGDTDGDGADVMLGDNGTITHPLVDGAWTTNPFNGAYTRETFLLDVATVTETPAPGTSGGDQMWGNDNDDLMYGQGDEDEMYGGAGDDYMEGNAASDRMYGNPDDDDMIGGTGRINDDPAEGTPGRIDRSTKTRDLTYAYPDNPPETVTVSLGDQMFGGGGSDVMLGDNGIISRASDSWEVLEYRLLADSFGDQAPRHSLSDVEGGRTNREVRMIDPAPGSIAGSDLMFGGPGEDDMYGQFDDSGGLDPQSWLIVEATIGDELYGEEGEDAMLGDNGVVENRVLSDPTQHIAPQQPFFEDERLVQGSLFRETTLEFASTGGHDRLLGGPGGDWMHGGAGNDLMNGNPGNDRLFGDDGDDVLWGGFDHDHVYGGHGKDYLDVKPRPEMTVGKKNQQMTLPPDIVEWFAFGEDANHQDNYEGMDYLYGGWGQDALQADEGDHGPVPGDRLIDWVGAYNVYYVCPALYGEFLITRAHSPSIVEFLQQLAEGDGAVEPANQGSSSFGEVAIVFPKEAKDNSHPVHDDNPGHFTCVQAVPPDLAIETTDGQTVVTPGQVLTYTLTVSNRGALDATGVTIRDTLPADTTFLAASDRGSYADGVVTWPVVSLAAASSLSRTVTVQLADPVPSGIEVITNTASVTDDGSHGPDLWPEDNDAIDADTVVTVPDLALDLTDGQTVAVPGQVLTYTLTVSNLGTADASGVVIIDRLPAYTTFLAASDEGVHTNGTITWPAFTLARETSASRTVSVRLDDLSPAGVEEITNQATVDDDGSRGPDMVPGDNEAWDRTFLEAAPDLEMAKDDGGVRVGPGQTLSYTVIYTNTGNQGAAGLVLAETVPSYTTFHAAASSAGWSCTDGSPAGTACTLAVDDLAAGGRDTAQFAVMVIDPLPTEVAAITNTASISDDGLNGSDPDPADNQDLVTTPVNHPPEAHEDSFIVSQDSLDNLFDVLQNDVDLDGDALVITAVSTATHGTVVHTGTELVYAPITDFSGTDLLTYTVSDGTLTATAIVTVVVEPGDEPPAATGDDVGLRRMAQTIS